MQSFLTKLSATLFVAAALLIGSHARANLIDVEIDYSNTGGSKIHFDGASHFSFTGATNNLHITTLGSAYNLLGEITGTYTIGTVTTTGSGALAMSTAAVTGTGLFRIHDGHGYNLVGTLSWLSIVQVGTGDFLNTAGAVNLTNITYSGTNPLLALFAKTPSTASDVLSFQFTPAKALSKLKTTKLDTSFSGSIYAQRLPDGGETALLLGMALAGLAFFRRKRAG